MRSLVRTALAIVLLAMIPGAVSAQAELGVRAGLNVASLNSTGNEEVSSRTTVNVGAFLTIPVSSVFGIQIVAGFSEKGADRGAGGASATVDIGYLQIPVLAKISLPTPGKVGGSLPGRTHLWDSDELHFDGRRRPEHRL